MNVGQKRLNSVSELETLEEDFMKSSQLLLVFGSKALMQDPSLGSILKERAPGASILGCSTAGEISGIEVHDDSLVLTAVEFEHTEIKMVTEEISCSAESRDVGSKLGTSLVEENLVHVFLLSDGLSVNGSELVKGLSSVLPEGVTVTGGLSGDGANFGNTVVLSGDHCVEGLVTAVGFYGDRLKVGYGSLGGWDPFGADRKITSSDGNVLYELNGKPALELYKEYLGDAAAELPGSGLLFPLSIKDNDDDTWVVRTILSVDEDAGSITFAGDVPEGATARLMKSNFDRLVDGAIGAAKKANEGLSGKTAELAVLISCVGRKMVLKQRVEEEVEGVRDVLGGTPILAGFYSYGEISPFSSAGRCELHNQTMTVTVLTEG